MSTNPKIIALSQFLGEPTDRIEIPALDNDNKNFVFGDQEYLVLTDEEADEAWDEELNNYIDECILPEIPETFRLYFDQHKWRCDAKIDGRGHSLNRYDGAEESEVVNGIVYFIFRQN